MSKTRDSSSRPATPLAGHSSDRRSDTVELDPVRRVELVTDEVNSLVSDVDVPEQPGDLSETTLNETTLSETTLSDGDGGNDGLLFPTLVRASAGTGKTYRLTARLLRILLQGASPESILATTFTRKAAGEILDRVLLSLARAADESDDR